MRALFCGNIPYETRYSELEELFSQCGKVASVDIKKGYAFVYIAEERDAEDAIHYLDGSSFGPKYNERMISVRWASAEHGRSPSRTLFVMNIEPICRDHDMERHFEPYGRVVDVRICSGYAFVEFSSQEGATEALKRTHRSKIFDRVISVEYAYAQTDEKGSRGDNVRRRNDAPLRPPNPVRRHNRASPVYDRHNGPSNPSTKSPDPVRYRSRSSVGRWKPDEEVVTDEMYEGTSNRRGRSPDRARRESSKSKGQEVRESSKSKGRKF